MTEIIFNSMKFRGLMAEHGQTNKSLSEALGISHIYVSEYKNGKRQPTIEILNKMIKIFRLKDYNIFFE